MTAILIGLCYVLGFLFFFGVISLLTWWLRYCIAVMYALMPAMLVFWFFWAWFVAVPVGLISDGGPVDQKVMAVSHWLGDANWELIKFCFKFPFLLFIWAADAIGYVMNYFGA
jgi:hypothetical protein